MSSLFDIIRAAYVGVQHHLFNVGSNQDEPIAPYDPDLDRLVLRWDETSCGPDDINSTPIPHTCIFGDIISYKAKLYFQNPARKYNTTNPLDVQISVSDLANIGVIAEFAKSLKVLGDLFTRDACVECVSSGAMSAGKVDVCPDVKQYSGEYDYITFKDTYLIEQSWEKEGYIGLKLLTGGYGTDPVMMFRLKLDDPDMPIMVNVIRGIVNARRNINRSCGLPHTVD